jgi:hypothetical protein
MLASDTQKQRTVRNELALCFGLSINPYRTFFISLDCVAMLLCSFLQSQGLSLRIASAIVRESWPLWLQMLSLVEDVFEPGLTPPSSKHIFFGVGVAVGKHPVVGCELGLDATLDKLAELTAPNPGDWLPPVGASLHSVLRQLAANERVTGVALPRLPSGRFTPAIGDPCVAEFFAAADDYAKAGQARLREKAKLSRNAARAMRAAPVIMAEPA